MREQSREYNAWECWRGPFLEVHSHLLIFLAQEPGHSVIPQLPPGAQMSPGPSPGQGLTLS